MKKFKIETYGCQMNVHESEKLAGMLSSFGFESTIDTQEADIIVFNTCCIRESAENKVRGNIGAVKGLKQIKKDLIIAVGGCMTQQDGEAEKLLEKFPFIDIIFGTQNLFLFKEFLQARLNKKRKIKEIEVNSPLPPENGEIFRTSGKNAYVNITYGCNNFCTYCIVPYVKGRERSRNEQDILNEIDKLILEKYETITLLGQNVNSYGSDLNQNTNFAKLIKKIAEKEGDFEVTFMTSHPKDLTDELIDVISMHEKISRRIHLPVQSGSSKILNLMNRKYTRENYLDLVNRIRAKIPDARISTDIIVGFPNETEEDFNETMNLIKDVKFTQIFAYMYSKRRGTPAEKMSGQVSLVEKHRRVNAVLNLQKDIVK